MKKLLLTFILICVILVSVKYFFAGYYIDYEVNGYKIRTIYNNKRLYYEIDNKYNFDIYVKSNFKKILIDKIEKLNTIDYECIYPIIKDVDTYPLCYKDGVQIDYNLIEDESLEIYKNSISIDNNSSFKYYNNLNNSYVAVWNYKGYYIMNRNDYENVNIFENDRYDNSLSFMKNEFIYMPDYSQEHTFNTLVTLNVVTKKIDKIKLNYDIDFDSYLVGEYNNKMYIFDNKYSILYEFDYKNNSLNIKGSNNLGYIKYVDGKEVSCSKSEYKVDKLRFYNNDSIYNYYYIDNLLYKTINTNTNIKTIIQNKNISIVGEYENYLYYVYESSFYRYSPKNGEEVIFYFNELEFNQNNTIFIYSY